MSDQDNSRSMRPSIRLQPGAELRAILVQWAKQANGTRRPLLRAINGGRQ